ncbi:DedA family protein [Candidatus Proelusimicrobium excrementi]|uniref:DedA family protein n=2 Tax=Candidatus Proelusimicrobium excrementi TaxID=3416222 RepID=UPI003CA99D94|nr:DedA family protein [Elusimicrobiaceae bacterium]
MEILGQVVDIFLHLDVYLNAMAASMGPWLYVLLFAVIFCETGLVVTPFLPGDSLIFAVGALAAAEGSAIKLPYAIIILILAAVLGDGVNFEIGKYIGPKIFSKETGFWLNKKHLLSAHAFYEKHGGKTIILARFIPIIRTFAPFVAGIGKMTYLHFALYNIAGAVVWVISFALGGYYFAAAPLVQNHFHYVVVAIIVISVLPAVYEFVRAKVGGERKG